MQESPSLENGRSRGVTLTHCQVKGEAVDQTETVLRRVMDAVRQDLFESDARGKLLYANREILEYHGISLDQFLEEGFRQWSCHPDDLPALIEQRERAIQQGIPLDSELRLLGKDGQYRWFLVRAHPMRDDQGRILRWFGIRVNIDDRKRAEENIRRVIDSTPALIHSARPDGYLDYFNHQWQDFLGVQLEQVEGWRWTSCVHADDVEDILTKWRQCLASGEPFEHECRVRRADGEYRWLLHRKLPLRDPSGTIVKWFGSSVDIDDRRRTEAHLRASEGRWRAIFENSSVGIVLISRDIRVVAANEAYQTMVGYTESELRNMHPHEYTHPDDVQASEAIYEDIRENRRNFAHYTKRYRRRDGHIIWVKCYATRLPSAENSDALFAAVVVDVTEQHHARKAMEDAFDEIKKLKDELYRENVALKEEIDKASMFEEIVGSSKSLRRVLEDVIRVAPTDSTFLITGETGTGKELIARAIHKRSRRGERAFVRVNCAAVAPTLIASELFGHEKGAFTGATQRRQGRFELAEGGTIFLDEVGELPEETQMALLRVLQEREFERVGSSQTILADVRVIAATNRNLEAAIKEENFRSDLFYRLNVFPIAVPPLRQRRDDIPSLVRAFVREFSKSMSKAVDSIPQATMDALQRYDWPGNIRELRNVIERGMILSQGTTLRAELPAPAVSEAQAGPATESELRLDDVERRHILEVLELVRWKVGGKDGAAARLGMNRTTLQARMRKLGIRRRD